MITKQKTNLELIQVLRGVASLLVVLFHATMNSTEILNIDLWFNFFLFGWSGVDIFFVLSGFIITYTCTKQVAHADQLFPYVRRRFVRIFPVYWIIIGLFLIVQLLLPAFYKTGYPFSFSNMLSTWFLLPGHIMVNGVSWTMSYELFFYLLFAMAFIIPGKKLAFSLLVLYIVTVIVLSMSIDPNSNSNEWIKLVISPLNIEFFMGVLIVVLVPHCPEKLSLPLIITGSLLFLLSGIFYDQHYYLFTNEYNRVILFGLPSFMIITGLVKYELGKKLHIHNILLRLGGASYSLYLLHLPLLVAGTRAIARFNIQNNIILQLLLLLLIVIICYGSILFYEWVEKPLITRLNRNYKTKKNKTAGLIQ